MSKSQFSNSQGVWITRSLFYEHKAFHPEIEPVYTLKTNDLTVNGKTYRSLHKLYVEAEDVTEYNFANEHLGGWSHWKDLIDTTFFEPYLIAMRDELNIKLKARAIQNVIAVSQDPSARGHLEANKFLIKEGLMEDRPTRGRPRKVVDAKQHLTDIKNEQNRIKEDLKRMGMN